VDKIIVVEISFPFRCRTFFDLVDNLDSIVLSLMFERSRVARAAGAHELALAR
jgi:hypothetical protein